MTPSVLKQMFLHCPIERMRQHYAELVCVVIKLISGVERGYYEDESNVQINKNVPCLFSRENQFWLGLLIV